jgi:hypothetical protein
VNEGTPSIHDPHGGWHPADPSDVGAAFPADGLADHAHAWRLPQPFPTSLVGLWPEATPPTIDEVAAAFAAYVGEPIAVHGAVDSDDTGSVGTPQADDGMLWNSVLSVPGLHAPVIVWVERARSFGPEDLPDASLAAHRWVVGCESLLSDRAPLDDFIALVRLLAGGLARIPAVLDTLTKQWFQRDELERLFLADEPGATEEVLWRIHAVGRAELIDPASPVWLYTVGLWRCGKPELEMLEVPGRHLDTAATLLNGIAALALTGPLPPPSAVASIGENLRVAFRPWREVAQYLDPDAVGSVADRSNGLDPRAIEALDPNSPSNLVMGVRAVVCAPEPKGSFRAVWTWPEQAIKLLEDGRGALYLSERSTEQLARRARATWSDFATAFIAIARTLEGLKNAAKDGTDGRVEPLPSGVADRPTFLVKAAFSDERSPDRGREHLWFEARSLVGDSVEAELLNTPQIATQFRPGDIVQIDRRSVSEWRVMLPNGGFGPQNARDLLAAVEQYRDQLRD